MYNYYKNIFVHHPKPLAFVDKDLLDKNIETILKRAQNCTIRIATKSVRCVNILKYILSSSSQFQGLMSFSAAETNFLFENGFDNILLGYPSLQESQITALMHWQLNGKRVYFMVDRPEHLLLLQKVAESLQTRAKICIDVDMSTHFPGLHFGVYRSSLSHSQNLQQFIHLTQSFPNIEIKGCMGYEAQIAGLGNKLPNNRFKNLAIKVLQSISKNKVAQKRAALQNVFDNNRIPLDFFNAGGTGSIESSIQEKWVTEVTVGSGFYQPHLFDYYSHFQLEPAMAYMIEVVRQPRENIFTAAGGGFVASGAAGTEKLPIPYLPKGIQWLANEGVGEVQTPFVYSGKEIKMGDPIILRHSKAGELCEHFNTLYIVSKGKIVDEFLTYRGQNQAF